VSISLVGGDAVAGGSGLRRVPGDEALIAGERRELRRREPEQALSALRLIRPGMPTKTF